MYGLALMRSGRHQEAAEIFAEILSSAPPLTDTIKLEYANLLFALGRFPEAKRIYADFVNETDTLATANTWATNQLTILNTPQQLNLSEYRTFLQSYLSFNGKSVPEAISSAPENFKDSGVKAIIESVAMVNTITGDQVNKWIDSQLTLIRNLVDEHEFTQANLLLDLLLSDSPKRRRTDLQLMKKSIDQAEIIERKKRLQLIKENAALDWNSAKKLFDTKDYDSAILMFTKLLNSDYKNDAQKKIIESSDLAAFEMRRKAARLFIKAKNASSLEDKKHILLESQTLLQGIILKYPAAKILDKVAQNLLVIDAEISKLHASDQ